MERERLLSDNSNDERYEGINELSSSEKNETSGSFSSDEAQLFEDAISSTGFGYFHYLLLFVCGWALASDSVEIQVLHLFNFLLFNEETG